MTILAVWLVFFGQTIGPLQQGRMGLLEALWLPTPYAVGVGVVLAALIRFVTRGR
ncbi:hypothetical protein [Xanthobacter aminoxidans]|uniref:hypothetical protein n=1 Tax=Xanthobacter aminoxidans TaxID=186280 RepID=UPI0020230D51|nr:hypothetical protein [Xanthobacter aminoxidans]MCL8384170.1 hypothetical protein [Xanthobacter aminoxidans]